MPRKPEPLEPWMLEAIQKIVRQNLSLRQAASQLGQEITPQQADNIQGRRRFADLLQEERLKFYSEVGRNPRLTKETVIGWLLTLAERLASDHEDAKAADALFKLAKAQGWLYGEGGQQPVLANLTQDDLDRIRAEVSAKQQEQEQAGEASEQKAPKVN